jgi:thymidylate synthase (FAD)
MAEDLVPVLDKGFVRLVQSWGNDAMIVKAARCSFADFEEPDPDRIEGMIRFMMDNGHGSVFEHCGMTVHVKAPLVVFREWHRHRTQSYNEHSARYSQIEPEYYVPEFVRHQVGKPGAYTFEPASENLTLQTRKAIEWASRRSFDAYEDMLDAGIAKEQARLVLPVNMYSQMYATANFRNWMQFLELRTSHHAMFEIREYAKVVEALLATFMPVAMEQFVSGGRVAP